MRLNLGQRLLLAAAIVLMLAGVGKNVAATILAGRGDEFASRQGLAYSLVYYRRAIALDDGNTAANVGAMKTLYLMHSPESFAAGLGLSARFLANHRRHDDAYFEVAERRAYMELLSDRYADAERDFEALALERKSAEDADLAFRSAQRARDRDGMRRSVALIAALDPRQLPSPRELRGIGL